MTLPDPLSYISNDDDIEQLANSIAYCNPAYDRCRHFDPYWQETVEGLMEELYADGRTSYSKAL